MQTKVKVFLVLMESMTLSNSCLLVLFTTQFFANFVHNLFAEGLHNLLPFLSYKRERKKYARMFAKFIPSFYAFVDIIFNNDIKLMVMSNKSGEIINNNLY